MSRLSRFAACVLAGLAGLPLSVFAEGEAYLTASDANGTSALLSAAAWDNPGDPFPSAEIDYYNVGYTLKTIAGQSISFAGRSLVLGDSSKYGTLGMLTGSGSCEVGFTGAGGLVIVYASFDCWHSNCTTIRGNVSFAENGLAHLFAANVRSSSAPASIVFTDGTFTGPASAIGHVYVKAGRSSNGLSTDMVLHLLSDTSRFLGTLRVVPYRDLTTPENTRHSTLRLGRYPFGGTVDLRSDGVLDAVYADSVVDVANLTMAPGAVLAFRWDDAAKTGATFRVTGALTVAGPVEVRPSALNVTGTNAVRVAVLKAPQGVELDPDDWVYVSSVLDRTQDFLLPAVELEVAPDDEGLSTLWAVARPVVRLLQNDQSGKTGSFSYDAAAPTNNWADGAYPTPDKDYLIAGNYSIRPKSSATEEQVFGGHSLTFQPLNGKSTTMALRAKIHTVDQLNIDVTAGVMNFDHYSGGSYTENPFATSGTMHLQGHITLSRRAGSYAANMVLANGRMVVVDSDISGNADLVLKPSTVGDSACFLELTGDNSRWTGRLSYTTTVVLGPAAHGDLYFTEGRNLGGALESFTYNALYLPWYGRLVPRAEATLDAVNRGIFVEDGAVISNQYALTVKERITYAGALKKKGEGLLRLGGEAPLFTSKQFTEPLVGTNVLDILQGGLTPVSSSAFEGLAVNFAEGTRLALDATAEPAGDVARYGMMLTNGLSSITVPEGGLPVEIDRTATATHKKLAICTVPTTAADALASSFRLTNVQPTAADGRVAVLVSQDNGNGTTTWTVEFVRGLRILLR